MADHPYKHQPDYAFWRRSLEGTPPARVDPVVKPLFKIGVTDRIVTAGSCFAQHIARYLRQNGFGYYVAEAAHPLVPPEVAEQHNYGQFSARYGNVYTTAQLLQLFKRAYGTFVSNEPAWVGEGGEILDPFRPQVQPGGYSSTEEMLADRAQHLACVRDAFEKLDVFVFTLGLTEHWRSKSDGSAFPMCPGTVGGEFDASRYEFVNSTANEVSAELEEFIGLLRERNPAAKVILTVSPVPLVATAEDRHVLVATTYSKAVLRVAAETVCRNLADVAYFPSYEIVTGSFNRGRYFDEDLRTVLEVGVKHVMRLFLKHYADKIVVGAERAQPDDEKALANRRRLRAEREQVRARRAERGQAREQGAGRARAAAGGGGARQGEAAEFENEMERAVQLNCDEEALDRE